LDAAWTTGVISAEKLNQLRAVPPGPKGAIVAKGALNYRLDCFNWHIRGNCGGNQTC